MVAVESLLTVHEVNQRLPLVRCIVRDIVEMHSDLAQRRIRLQALRERHPALPTADSVYEQEVLQMESELTRDEQKLGEFSRELEQIGGALTNAASGTVDFPGDLDGERVSLCWRFGESEILYWHADDCGSSDRLALSQGLDSTFSGSSQLQRD
jgi:hypothetical protein